MQFGIGMVLAQACVGSVVSGHGIWKLRFSFVLGVSRIISGFIILSHYGVFFEGGCCLLSVRRRGQHLRGLDGDKILDTCFAIKCTQF